MKTVTIGTIKGGDGKSSLCILLSRYLASIGKRILTIDLDVQNSTSYSLLPDGDPGGRHIVRAIIEDDIASQTIQLGPCHFLVQCDYKLTQLRTMSAQTIRSCLSKVSDDYDFCLIDTPPYYDNIVISGMTAADLIIMPVMLKNSFSIKASRFVREALSVDAPLLAERLFVLYNFFEDDGVGEQYMEHFQADTRKCILWRTLPKDSTSPPSRGLPPVTDKLHKIRCSFPGPPGTCPGSHGLVRVSEADVCRQKESFK